MPYNQYMNLDESILFFLNNLAGHSRVFDILVVFLADYLQYILGLLFLLLVYRSRERFLLFRESVISGVVARLIIVPFIRLLYHRPRPFLVYNLNLLIAETGRYSFPSGHSALFFALASAIYFYDKKWGVGFFAAAIFMNISRVIAGIHYPSDILGGLVVGVAVAYITHYFVHRSVPSQITM